MRNQVKWTIGITLTLLSLALSACNMASDPGTDDLPQEPQARALLLGPVDSPIHDQLSTNLVIETFDGSQDVTAFDLIILDGDALTPQEIRDHQVIATAIKLGKRVLALDVTGEHKQVGLGHHIGVASQSLSPGYLLHTASDTQGKPYIVLLEYGNTLERHGSINDGLGSLSAQDHATTPVTPAATKAFVKAVMSDLTNGNLASQQTPPSGIPNDLLYTRVSYIQPVAWRAGNAGRKDGGQDVGWKMEYDFYVFLDNEKSSQAPYQWVVAEVLGTASPTNGTGNFLNMTDNEKAWWQDRLKFSLEVSGSYANALSLYSTTPETVNNQTQVTSGSSFNIGFEQSADNASVGGSYTYTNTQTKTLTDWKVSNDSSPNGSLAAWDYRSQNPDADGRYNEGAGGYNSSSGYPSEPPDLSLYTLQAPAQAIWRTQGVINDWVTFTLASEQHVADTYCETDFRAWCETGGEGKRGYVATVNNFSIDMGAVLPIAVTGISVDPNPVLSGQQATGTLTLASPARTDITVSLSTKSQANNASVIQTPIVIPKGDTSGTFELETNANNLRAGDETSVTVSAFYAGTYSTEFTVRNEPYLDLAFSDTTIHMAENPDRTGSLTLSTPAPEGGLPVKLTFLDYADNPDSASASFPATVTVPEGEVTTSVPITFTNGGPLSNAYTFYLYADGGKWGADEVRFLVARE